MIKLIVNADDFGIHTSVNKGIVKGHCEGIITSTSLLANGSEFESAVDLGFTYPNLGIGIHTCLVGGLPPVCNPDEVSSLLTSEGVLPTTYLDFIKRCMMRTIRYDELYKELAAQFKKIIDTGLTITHVDGHQHMHILPQVLPIVVDLIKQYGIKKIRIPREYKTFVNGVYNPIRFLGKVGLSTVADMAKRTVAQEDIKSPDYFWGMINGGQLIEPALAAILSSISKKAGVHEIMTHPGLSDNVLNQAFDWHYHWEEELRSMMSISIGEYIRRHNIALINYGEL